MFIEFKGPEKSVWRQIMSILSDPFFYALKLPTVAHVMFYSAIFLAIVSGIMILVWFGVRGISLGAFPHISETPPKFFPALAMVSLFTLCAGIIHKRMTSEEIRGRFVAFSSKCWIENEAVVFQVIDKRSTQLIGTNVVVDVMYTGEIPRSKHLPSKLICKTINLGSPGLLVIPTNISVPFAKIFDTGLDCLVCGKRDFPNPYSLTAHMGFFHKAQILPKKMVHNLHNLLQFRIRIRGVDEISGKAGMAEKTYTTSEIVPDPSEYDENEDDFSIIDNTSAGGSPKKYVHIDFKYT